MHRSFITEVAVSLVTLAAVGAGQLVPPTSQSRRRRTASSAVLMITWGFLWPAGATGMATASRTLPRAACIPTIRMAPRSPGVFSGLNGSSRTVFTVTDLNSILWGVSVALVHDLNGGGKADLVIGVPEWSDTPSDPSRAAMGRVCVFFGENWAGVTQTRSARGADIVINGSEPFRYFGWSVADAGRRQRRRPQRFAHRGARPGQDDNGASQLAPTNYPGKAYLLFGSAHGLLPIEPLVGLAPTDRSNLGSIRRRIGIWNHDPRNALRQSDFLAPPFIGASARDRFGYSVASSGT